MSFILLAQHQLTLPNIKNTPNGPTTTKLEYTPLQTPQVGQNLRTSECEILKQMLPYSSIWDGSRLVLSRNTEENYIICANMKLDRFTCRMRLNFSILNQRQTYFKVSNIRALPQLASKINTYLNSYNQHLLSISFNMSTGQILIKLPAYHPNGFFNLLKGQSLAQFLCNAYIRKYIWLINLIIRQGNGQTSDKNQTLQNIYRYCQMMHIANHLNESRVESQNEIIIKDKMKRESIKRRVRDKKQLEPQWQALHRELFGYENKLDRFIPTVESDFLLEEEEMRYINKKIGMPAQAKPKNPYQNLMVLNFISVHNLCNLRLNKINSGGFSQIYLTTLQYQYVYSSQNHQPIYPSDQSTEESLQRNILQKCVIIKVEDGKGQISRNHHEISILKNIKNGSSVYLPKYYIIVNKANPFKNAIVMDYIPYKNLHQYMATNSQSISLLTKLYLIFSIVQALRYIRDYRIVHLDLKPNNVMIFFNMLIKLIDFGQSYHPEICLKQHSPGYTLPYSCPQIFKKGQHIYTSKSDVFSLGMIMFQMIYKSYPYDIFEQTECVDEVMKDYLKKWYFTPQGYQTYGEINAIRIINLIISKCLSPIPANRPELDWIALLLRQCFQLMN